ncbi:MAG: GumC family protein [Phocaeicola sp.]
MKEDFNTPLPDESTDELIDFRQLLHMVMAYWYWFAASVICCVAVAFLYLQFTTPIYEVHNSIMIKDNQKSGGGVSEAEALGFFNSTSNFDNEMAIIQSYTLICKVVEELNLYVRYYKIGTYKDVEQYKNLPFQLSITPQEAQQLPHTVVFDVQQKGTNQWSIETQMADQSGTMTPYTKEFSNFPTLVTTPIGTFTFTAGELAQTLPIDTLQPFPKRQWRVVVATPRGRAEGYRGALTITPASKQTTIAKLIVRDNDRQRGIDFLNKLVEIYNRDANNDKNEVVSKSAQFINERIAIINMELGSTEKELERFKRDAGITNLQSDAQLAVSENSAYEKRRVENATQMELVRYLSDYANNPANLFEIIPANIGLNDPSLTTLITSYNEMLLERNRLLITSSENNPTVINLTNSVNAMRKSVQMTIKNAQNGLALVRKDIEREASRFANRISGTPEQERQLVSITRQQEIKAELYLMLLQKREENAITLAATANNARIIDPPLAAYAPIAPKKQMFILAGLLIGLLIPTSILVIIELMRNKIENIEDVKKITHVPLLGDIPLGRKKEGGEESRNIVVKENLNDQMAEAFREIRTNLQYILGKEKKIILVTSSQPGEGKTFTCSNLAMSMALLGKKVLIVGLDIRKPALTKMFQIDPKKAGISNYLSDNSYDLLDLIRPSRMHENLDILPSGTIPPNPTELVARPELEQAFEVLKKRYDYIFLDSAPIGVVSDTKLIARVADATLYICRANVTPKSLYGMINGFYNSQKLPTMCTLVNGVNTNSKRHKYGYGSKYGYGYEESEGKVNN